MKILIVITKSELGGAQVFALNLARGLKKAGEEVVVAGGPGEYLPQELEKAGITFKRLENLERSRNPFKSLSFIKEINQYVVAGHFDAVHLNSTNALLGVWGLRGIKTIFTVHGLSLLDSGHKAFCLVKMAYRWFFRAAFKKLDQIVFVSKLNLDFANKSGLLKGLEAKSHLIYNGLESENLLSREETRTRLHLGSDDYIYGSIGRLAYPKNYEFLIHSYFGLKALKPNAKLLIIGEGPEREKYENLVKLYKLEKEVVLTGEIVNASRYLQAFDLFVLPSIFEDLSLSLIAAVQAGVPALASRVGGNEEVIGVNNCFTLDDKADFLRLIQQNNFKIEGKIDFSADKMVGDYLKVYKA